VYLPLRRQENAPCPPPPTSPPAPDLYPVRRALISVSDKTGLIDFAQFLADLGVELVSTGGTRAKLPSPMPALP
jgi:hypothetical protein